MQEKFKLTKTQNKFSLLSAKKRLKNFKSVVRCAIWYHLYNIKNVKNMFSCEFYEIFKNTSFYGTYPVAASIWKHAFH